VPALAAQISILTPVFNCANTLAMALASLQAQTFADWECIVVDDGSTDNPAEVVTAAADRRIFFSRLDRNRGRGHARQKALEMATGEYIGWLDSDDWIFPDKLRLQLDLLQREPGVAVVSTGAAIVNDRLELMGVRRTPNDSPVLQGRIDSVSSLPFMFPASIVRADLAKRTGFSCSYRQCEDTDFVLRALFGKPYAIINRPLYVYREVGVTPLSKVLSSLNVCCEIYWNFAGAPAPQRAAAVAITRVKQAGYCAAAALGKWDQSIARRSRAPLESERQRYEVTLRALTTASPSLAKLQPNIFRPQFS
jgi:glycosyltransferase involved in cell wall biosynthesis